MGLIDANEDHDEEEQLLFGTEEYAAVIVPQETFENHLTDLRVKLLQEYENQI